MLRADLRVTVMSSGLKFPFSACGREGTRTGMTGRMQQKHVSFMAGFASKPVWQEYWEEYIMCVASLWSGWVVQCRDGFPYLHSYKKDQEICLWCGIRTLQALIRLTGFFVLLVFWCCFFFPSSSSTKPFESREMPCPLLVGRWSGRVTAVFGYCCCSAALGWSEGWEVFRPPASSCALLSLQMGLAVAGFCPVTPCPWGRSPAADPSLCSQDALVSGAWAYPLESN